MSTHPYSKRFAGVALTGRESGWEHEVEARKRRHGGRVLTELINELALRDKA